MRHRKNHGGRGERGSSRIEAMAAICILFLIFFVLLQINRWSLAHFFCQYAAFYGAKGMSLGYDPQFPLRGARVAGISVSGEKIGSADDSESSARSYLTNGDASGVAYRYWHPQRSSDPWFEVGGDRTPGERAECVVRLRNQPLIAPTTAPLLGIAENPVPRSKVSTYNWSRVFLED